MNTTACFVAIIDLSLKEKLKEDLVNQGFALTTPPYTIFSAKKKGISVTLYTSGKITVQGSEKNDFITFYLEPEILQELSYSHPEIKIDLTPRIGIDEAGKGDYFGPLVIAGVYADEAIIREMLAIGVKDSKQMSDPAIVKLAAQIRKITPFSLVRLPPATYNNLYAKFKNLNRLLGWGHATAITELVIKTGCKKAIIDQFASDDIVIQALAQKKTDIQLTQRHRGEEDPVVAAASILARAAFVDDMVKLEEKFGMQIPKGASTLVKKQARILYQKFGNEGLGQAAKLHFKTTEEITSTFDL